MEREDIVKTDQAQKRRHAGADGIDDAAQSRTAKKSRKKGSQTLAIIEEVQKGNKTLEDDVKTTIEQEKVRIALNQGMLQQFT